MPLFLNSLLGSVSVFVYACTNFILFDYCGFNTSPDAGLRNVFIQENVLFKSTVPLPDFVNSM